MNDYTSKLDLLETEIAIKYIKDNNLPYDINSFLKLEQVFKNDINKTDIPIPKKEALLIRKAFHSI